MKLSELTERDVGIYCRIEGEDAALVPAYIDAAKSLSSGRPDCRRMKRMRGRS